MMNKIAAMFCLLASIIHMIRGDIVGLIICCFALLINIIVLLTEN